MPEMFRKNESNQCDRGGGCYKKNTQISGIVGSKGKAASKNQSQYPIRRLSKIREGDL